MNSSKHPTGILADKLQAARRGYTCGFPERQLAREFGDSLLGLLFPHFSTNNLETRGDIESEIARISDQLEALLARTGREILESQRTSTVQEFLAGLSTIHDSLLLDARAILTGDPAARTLDEVLIAYPGFFAIAIFRIAHSLYNLRVPLLPRMLTEYAHQVTGIDIHPGATIGRSFFIDHGTGIVIGETTVIRDNVKIYQGVTLGALSVDKEFADQKRHPTIESNVVVYSNATILGGKTTIGHDSIIGGNVWITASVPPHSTVYHRQEVRVKSLQQPVIALKKSNGAP
jgi:serine O-acetyltransferase